MRRKLTTNGYNERHQACAEMVKILSYDLPVITALRDVSVDDFNRLYYQLLGVIEKRARSF